MSDDDDAFGPLMPLVYLYFGAGLIGIALVFGPLILAAAVWMATHYGITLGVALAILKAKLKNEDAVKAGIEAGAEGVVVEAIVGELDKIFK